ncbi:uncharacterized protein LOC143428259 [Xylocopa sonorina]|uniref:uncharacterized protein LOC143428259 n=1 Tax=Xylocopa sonorina TaxID=1818115 RepID=UPI00403ABA27
MATRMFWTILLQLLSVFVHGYENVGFDGWYQPVPHRPVDIITDIINDLGVRILQQYTSHGNVAFSPTGVGFVLAALYEGSAGKGRQQIAGALGFPRDSDIIRIGFRDIHRRLRTYLNADGFLGGLTLNRENTRLRPEYEDILRFYGFDLFISEEETNETSYPGSETTTDTAPPITEQSTTEGRTTGETTAEPVHNFLIPTESTASNTLVPLLDTSVTTDKPIAIVSTTDTSTVPSTPTSPETILAVSSTETSPTILPLVNHQQLAEDSTNSSFEKQTTANNQEENTDSSTVATEQLQLTTIPSIAMTRRKRRNVRGPRGFFSSYPDEGIWMQDLGFWKPYSPILNEASVRDSTEISFLVNGCDVSSVTASRYFAVLPFAYFPSLHAVALEFPLDHPRYNIVLIMATDSRDTYRLANDLGGKSLRLLRNQLQSTWVRATIPSFMLRGFVTLTSILQKLGISDVFEPRAADLSLMTSDFGVYARDVQQSIGINIRNYMKPDRTHSRTGLFERAGPEPFTVVHPFLYFIVDAETSVALIAGRVNDPLNSRIL